MDVDTQAIWWQRPRLSASQGTPRINGHSQKLESNKEGFPGRFQRERGSASTRFQTSSLQKHERINAHVLATQFGVLCHSRPGNNTPSQLHLASPTLCSEGKCGSRFSILQNIPNPMLFYGTDVYWRFGSKRGELLYRIRNNIQHACANVIAKETGERGTCRLRFQAVTLLQGQLLPGRASGRLTTVLSSTPILGFALKKLLIVLQQNNLLTPTWHLGSLYVKQWNPWGLNLPVPDSPTTVTQSNGQKVPSHIFLNQQIVSPYHRDSGKWFTNRIGRPHCIRITCDDYLLI